VLGFQAELALARSARLQEDVALSRNERLREHIRGLFTDLTILSWPAEKMLELEAGVALIVSADIGLVDSFADLLASRVGCVLKASNAGSALGLAIATQPEQAIIDARLEFPDGVNLALDLAIYAPGTRALIVTDDGGVAQAFRSVGYDTESFPLSVDSLLSRLACTS
jgi:ActR/RegA family two-component response regulator